jgi:hypothetical protein
MYFECSGCWIVIEAANPPAHCPDCVGVRQGFVRVERARLQFQLLARRFQRELAQDAALPRGQTC